MFVVGPNPPPNGWHDPQGQWHRNDIRGLGRCVPCGDPPLNGLHAVGDSQIGNAPLYILGVGLVSIAAVGYFMTRKKR